MARAAEVSARTIEKAKTIVRAGLAEEVISGRLPSNRAYSRAKTRSTFPESVVYFLQAGPFVKIGKASFGDVGARIEDMQTGCPYDMRILAVVPGDLKEERALHSRFSAFKVRGEWFRLEPELSSHIDSLRKTPIAF